MPATPGPVSSTERAVAPDLARGAMLLFIALANSSGYAAAATVANAGIQALERGVNLVLLTFVHARAYPVFAIMFGYSLVQLARRQESAGVSRADVRSLLLRRHVWLIVFGFFHAALLYFADFLAAYGIIGIVATYLLLYRERVQRVVLWMWGVSLLELIGLVVFLTYRWTNSTVSDAQMPSNASASSTVTDYIASIATRLNEWPAHTATVLPAVFIVCLGIWAANRRLLEDLHQHRRWLRAVALVCLPIAFVGGLPLALAEAKVVQVDAETFFVMNLLHKVSGMFGGPGYVALIGLLAASVPGGGWAGRIIALGRRSLSGYLFQSFAWLMLLAPFTLYLGGKLGAPLTTSAVVAIAVWIVSIYAAGWMERRDYRGPVEILLRRLTYRAPIPGARQLSQSKN